MNTSQFDKTLAVHVHLLQHATADMPDMLKVTWHFVEKKWLRFSFWKIVQLLKLIEINFVIIFSYTESIWILTLFGFWSASS